MSRWLIHSTAANAGLLDIKLVPERHNKVKVLLLMDVGGTMDEHIHRVEELFSAAKTEFKHLEFYYFHNCVYDFMWKNNRRRYSEKFATWDVIHKYNQDYKLIFVGDATMSPYEILQPGGSVEYNNEEAGVEWLQRLTQAFPKFAWINPEPQGVWQYRQSISIIQQLMGNRMYPLSLKGLQETTIGQVVESSDALLKGFKTLSDKLNQITETIDKGEGSIGKFIHDDAFYVNLNKVMLEAQTLVSKIRDGDGTAGRLINDPKLYNDLEASIASIQTTLAKVEKGEGTVGKLVHDQEIYDRINKAAARLDTVSERLDKVTAQIESGKGTVGKLIYDDSLHNDFTSAVASLKSISERLDRGEGTAGKLLHDDQLYNNLNALSSESVKLLYDFRQNPKKYLSVKVALF